jgi:hypothetical protein
VSDCGKIAFYSQGEIRHYLRTFEGWGAKRHPYRCPKCGLWHLTSLNSTELKRIRKRVRERS